MVTPLGGIIADKAKAAAARGTKDDREAAHATRMAELASVRRGEVVDIPGFGQVLVEVIGARQQQEVEASVHRTMRERGFELTMVTSHLYELERAIQTLPHACRAAGDRAQVFGTAEQWAAINAEMILAAWNVYGDVRERLDPIAHPLTDDEAIAIEVAVKKKEPLALRTFGLVKLCDWLTTTDALLSTSPSPKSPSGESSSDS